MPGSISTPQYKHHLWFCLKQVGGNKINVCKPGTVQKLPGAAGISQEVGGNVYMNEKLRVGRVKTAAFYILISIHTTAEPACLSWESQALLCWMLLALQFLLRADLEF